MRAYTSRLKKAATQKAEAEQRLEVAKKMKVSKAEYNSAQESVRHAITSFDSAKFRAEEASELLNAVHSAKRQKKEANMLTMRKLGLKCTELRHVAKRNVRISQRDAKNNDKGRNK